MGGADTIDDAIQITFDHAGVVNRIFQHPLNPKVVLETVELKADPEEVDHIDDPDVVRTHACTLTLTYSDIRIIQRSAA
jgi:hypothetical protein